MIARWFSMPARLWLLVLASLALTGCGLLGPPPPVLLLVTVDTLRADHLGAYGDRRGLTPHLDRLAAESVVFESAYAPASFTLPSLSALLTSRYPEEVGIAGNSTVLSKDALTLASWLQQRGWHTGAVVSNYVLRPPSGFGAGFDRYDATFPQRELVRPVPERVAAETTAAALRQLDALQGGRRPVFLWVHYQDPHGPYAPSPERRAHYLEHERIAPDGQRELPESQGQSGMGAIPRYQFLENHHDPAFYRAGYAGEVALVDEAVGGLLEGVAARGLSQRATLVFAADHGESLGEDDYWFSHGELLSEPLVHVPLFLRVPGRAPSRRAEVASLLDVFPTLVALLGGPAPAGLRGRDLLTAGAATRPSEVYMTTLAVSKVPRFGLIARGFKYLVSMEAAGPSERLLRLGDDSLNLALDQPDVFRSLRAGLAAARTGLRRVGTSEQVLSPEEREGFKALGYLEGR